MCISRVNICTFLICTRDNLNLTLTDIAIGFLQSSYEFDEDSGDVVIQIHKDFLRLSEQNLQISIQLDPGSRTATEDADFTFDSMSFVFLPSEQEMDVPLTILNDNILEELESFILTVVYSSPLSTPQNTTTEIFIRDNDSKFVTSVFVGMEVLKYYV